MRTCDPTHFSASSRFPSMACALLPFPAGAQRRETEAAVAEEARLAGVGGVRRRAGRSAGDRGGGAPARWRARGSASSRRPPRPPRAATARAASLPAPGLTSRARPPEPTRRSLPGAARLGADRPGGRGCGRYRAGCPPGGSAEAGTRPPAAAVTCPLTSRGGPLGRQPAFL